MPAALSSAWSTGACDSVRYFSVRNQRAAKSRSDSRDPATVMASPSIGSPCRGAASIRGGVSDPHGRSWAGKEFLLPDHELGASSSCLLAHSTRAEPRNQIWISATTMCSSAPKRIAEKSIHLSRWRRPWSKAGQLDRWVRERREWLAGYAVQTAGNAGSEPLIFVLRAAHSNDLTLVIRRSSRCRTDTQPKDSGPVAWPATASALTEGGAMVSL
jgi:hypothetical protein